MDFYRSIWENTDSFLDRIFAQILRHNIQLQYYDYCSIISNNNYVIGYGKLPKELSPRIIAWISTSFIEL